MASFVNVAKFNAASSGTGDFVVSSVVTGYQTPALAGAVNAAIYRYRAESADLSEWEIGYGAYTSGTTTQARTTVLYNSAGTGTGAGQSGAGSKISFSAAPQVAMVLLAEDVAIVPSSSTDNAAVRFDGTGGKTLQDSALIIADTTGSLSRSGNGGIPIQGTNTNDSAAAGYVGEFVESTVLEGSAVSITTSTDTNVTSISLTAGDWDVWGSICFQYNGGASATVIFGWVSTTSATLPTRPNGGGSMQFGTATNVATQLPTGMRRISISSTTTVYLSGRASFTPGTMAIYGYIGARRVR